MYNTQSYGCTPMLIKSASKLRLSELWTSSSADNRGTDSYSTSGRRSLTSPLAFFDNGRTHLGGLHSAAYNIRMIGVT